MDGRATDRLEHAVAAALRRIGVVPGDRILIALSGGADSVALTCALDRLGRSRRNPGIILAAAHLNHRLRGAESERDERFVRDLCARLGIGLIVEQAEGLAGSPNLEERARELRYDFLARAADRCGARFVATAHHADDQAETVLMRLLRGSGVAGLAAMEESGRTRIVRPLLEVRRSTIIAYLSAINADWVTDSSNLSHNILRNRIRSDLIPSLERDYAPQLARRLAGLAAEMRSVDDYLAAEARLELRRREPAPGRLALEGFAGVHPALRARVVREWLRERGGGLRAIDRRHLESIVEFCIAGAPGAALQLPRGWRLRHEYDSVVFEMRPQPAGIERYELVLGYEGLTVAEAAGFTFEAKIGPAPGPDLAGAGWPGGALEACFDADEVDDGLVVRGFRRGDRVQPLGMAGSRKVQDLFVDRKLPRERRRTWPIVVRGEEILWIPGMVRSRLALVTRETRRWVCVTAKPRANLEKVSLP